VKRTQVECARAGDTTPEMRYVARYEGRDCEYIRKGVAAGRIVIPKNRYRRISHPCGIGEGLKTKVNANIGTSKGSSSISLELAKVKEAIALGTDTIMDLSTGSGIREARRKVLKYSRVPVGTVPIYEIAVEGMRRYGSLSRVPVDYIFKILEDHAKDGADFFTVHAGVTRKALDLLKKNRRLIDIVSRGGAFLAEWMTENDRENPFYDYFDRVVEISNRYDVSLSLGDGLRPGSIRDATDAPQLSELATLGELRKIALTGGVQVIIEGPGHVPINQIETNVRLEKSLCGGAPFYVLGPLVTDVAPGYDHITAAIGGAIAASAGADFLCYVTPSEHLRLPLLDDVREGVIAAKIAAHAADVAKGIEGAIDWDVRISRARQRRDWAGQFKLAIDKRRPAQYRKASLPGTDDACTMCGEYCSIKMSEKCLGRPS